MKTCDVAAYIWPSYTGKEPRSRQFWEQGVGEWQSVLSAEKRTEEQLLPRKPLWGTVDEADPAVMEFQIKEALRHGVNVFIYDWYWYDRRPFLEQCLDDGFLSAKNNTDNEIDLLLKEAEIDRVDTVADVEYHVGTLCGQPVVITRSGIGKIRSSSVATSMMNKYPISKVIFTGIAGGVADETQVLDEVIATRLVEHDYGVLSNDGFAWRSGDPGIGNEAGVYYDCDPQLVQLAYGAAVEVVGENHVFQGTIATGDQFIANSEYVRQLRTDYDAYACEMEGAAVAVVCLKHETPFVVIRALSDKADGNAHESYENFGDVAADNSSRIVMKMLTAIGK